MVRASRYTETRFVISAEGNTLCSTLMSIIEVRIAKTHSLSDDETESEELTLRRPTRPESQKIDKFEPRL